MSNPSSWMWTQACDLLDQAERLHRQFFRLGAFGPAQAVWEPPVDVFEDEREVIIVVALPGVAIECVEITHERDVLLVRANRRVPLAGLRRVVRQLEIPYGTFERRIQLPGVRFEAGRSECVDGCLILRLRKAESL